MYGFLLAVLVLDGLFLSVVILLQAGKGGGLAASVGGGASTSMLGGRQATTFLSKVTTYLASGFLVLCLLLAVLYDDDEGVPQSATERMLSEQPVPMGAPVPFDEGAAAEGASETSESAIPQ